VVAVDDFRKGRKLFAFGNPRVLAELFR